MHRFSTMKLLGMQLGETTMKLSLYCLAGEFILYPYKSYKNNYDYSIKEHIRSTVIFGIAGALYIPNIGIGCVKGALKGATESYNKNPSNIIGHVSQSLLYGTIMGGIATFMPFTPVNVDINKLDETQEKQE